MANPNPKQENLQHDANTSHGFYFDGFLPCDKCSLVNCPNKNKFLDHRGRARCFEEKEFFESTAKEITENFQLDSKDFFQLPQMIMTMIKLKRMNRFQAEKGLTGSTLLFNPKTGVEHKFDTPGVLNRDSYYAQKGLLSWLDSLKLSRQARDAKDGIDILAKMMGYKAETKK